MMENIDIEELRFDEDTHTYIVDDEVIPSVTEILKPLSQIKYAQIDESILARAAQRGTDVHSAIETWLKYRFDDISDDLSLYYEAFKKWFSEHEVEPVYSEVKMYSKKAKYAGTLDCVAKVDGKLTLIDFKTTATINDLTCAPQLEAYAHMLEEYGIVVESKIILQVRKDGSYKVREYPIDDVIAWRAFESLRYVYDYIRMDKMKKGRKSNE